MLCYDHLVLVLGSWSVAIDRKITLSRLASNCTLRTLQ